ncbi:hypothetical protein Bbelb_216680 [Branchiostoma belcheri]|nr:hypothetical protein Bbelb_216680 [Branchiostoma belcheri]
MVSGQQTDILVMDFAKAFDKVNHSLLQHKLHYYGIRGEVNVWITAFLTDRTQAVVVNGECSDFVSVKSGVPQGSVLGPLLFLIYINDLPSALTSSARLFADDTAAYTYNTITSIQDQALLQQDLERLAEWERKWDMSFHPGKCQTLRVTPSRRPLQYDYQLHGHTLKTVPSVKYLGVAITKDLTWKEHINNLCNKANKTLGFLKRNLKISFRRIKELAYKTYVRPILEYAATVWDPHSQQDLDRLEAVQRRAARFVMRRYRQTSSPTEMLEDLNWPSLQARRKTARLAMLYRIQHNIVCTDGLRGKLQPAPVRERRVHGQQFVQPGGRTQYRMASFLPRRVKEWNALPQTTVEATSVDTFVSRASKLHQS